MESDMKHGEHEHAHGMAMEKHGHMHGHHRPWQSNWKSPVSIGIFALTVTLSLAVLLYTVLNLVGVIIEASHPAASQQGMSQQELQQLMQSSQGSAGATTGAAGQ